ncbi:MAG: hypothetical protein KQH63_18360 [Desulfobulbaceae bacterium]|nr:hypothetical protein [Desulfobulbaceae bacterium]
MTISVLNSRLQNAQQLAQSAQNTEFLFSCRQIITDFGKDKDALLKVGALLFNFGFHSDAAICFKHICNISPNDLRPLVNLANIARETGDHSESRRLYSFLLEKLPDNKIIRRNVLVSLEYDPNASDLLRKERAGLWGEWAVAQAGGPMERPSIIPTNGRPLKVGYLSADFCQHTVGLFVKDVIASHDRERFIPYSYSAGTIHDWVTKSIKENSQFRDIAQFNDTKTANIIRGDKIDILIDLSGHTAGSRLTVFALRPAPLQVSWLGYFSTTGLPVMDAVLLDKWHAPEWMDKQFIEPIVRIPAGRFCYTPVPFAPEVAPLPYITNKYITFGSFNNTAKYNDSVFKVWAKILRKVKNSRLILKWKSFNDEGLQKTTLKKFARLGIASERIELRPASFHVKLLEEYGDIDIALDPFPFTGGLTSCEALYMGVPIITLPQSRVVSRQTYAFLSTIGIPELAANDEDSYTFKAVDLAFDIDRLCKYRSGLRKRMKDSPLCNTINFTKSFEKTLLKITRNRFKDCICRQKKTKTTRHSQ